MEGPRAIYPWNFARLKPPETVAVNRRSPPRRRARVSAKVALVMYSHQQARTTVLVPRLRRLYSIRLVKEPLANPEKVLHKVAIRGPQDVFAFMRPFAEQEAAE